MTAPPRRIIVVPCSGIGKPYGTISRMAAYLVTTDYRQDQTELVPLAPLVMGDEEYGRIVAGNPAITIDGCPQKCATKMVQQSGGHVARECPVIEAFRSHRDLKPQGIAALNEDGEKLAVALAEKIVTEVDTLAMAGGGGDHA